MRNIATQDAAAQQAWQWLRLNVIDPTSLSICLAVLEEDIETLEGVARAVFMRDFMIATKAECHWVTGSAERRLANFMLVLASSKRRLTECEAWEERWMTIMGAGFSFNLDVLKPNHRTCNRETIGLISGRAADTRDVLKTMREKLILFVVSAENQSPDAPNQRVHSTEGGSVRPHIRNLRRRTS